MPVSEDASEEHVVAEVGSLVQVLVDIGQRVAERPQNHVFVVVAEDHVADSARSKDVLLSDCLDLPDNVFGL